MKQLLGCDALIEHARYAFSVSRIAEILGVTPAMVYKYLQRRRFPPVRRRLAFENLREAAVKKLHQKKESRLATELERIELRVQ